ncbi:hypothetical protein [Cloacibacillus porcorum]
MQIYSVARNVLGALGPRVKVPVLDCKKEKTKKYHNHRTPPGQRRVPV